MWTGSVTTYSVVFPYVSSRPLQPAELLSSCRRDLPGRYGNTTPRPLSRADQVRGGGNRCAEVHSRRCTGSDDDGNRMKNMMNITSNQ